MNFETLIRSLLCPLIALIIASCGPSESPTVDDSVSWPEINRFDDLAFEPMVMLELVTFQPFAR